MTSCWPDFCAVRTRGMTSAAAVLAAAVETKRLREIFGFIGAIFWLHLSHFFGHRRFVLLVLFFINVEFVAHVVRVFVFPILARIGVSQFRRLPLQELFMGRIS